VRDAGGIPPLVALLAAWDIKVQRAAAAALRTLAFKNEDNKRQIAAAGALPLLVQVWGWQACFENVCLSVCVSARLCACMCVLMCVVCSGVGRGME
jgi:hypothetical protein